MAKPLLEIIAVDIFYGDAQAVWDVSFHVGKDKIVAMVGANGAGKSTILDTISGFIRPRNGEILFSGEPLVNVRPEDVVTRAFPMCLREGAYFPP